MAYGPWSVVGTGGPGVGIGALVCGWHRGSGWYRGPGLWLAQGAVIGIDGLCLVRGYHRNMMNGERRVTYVGFNN